MQTTKGPQTETLESQRNELLRIINNGFSFKVEVKEKKRLPGISGFFRKRITVKKELNFAIKEMPLSVLDRISLKSLEINMQEIDNADNNVYKQFTRKHIKTMSEIIAIAVLGTDYDYYHGSKVIPDTQKLKELTTIFYHFLKPSDLYNILQLVDVCSNLGDFMNSTRLVTAAGTMEKAKADGVEEQLQA